MKKLLLAGLASVMLISGSMVAFSVPQQPVYEPIIEACWGPTFPQTNPGGRFVMACIPGGTETCSVEFCFGDTR